MINTAENTSPPKKPGIHQLLNMDSGHCHRNVTISVLLSWSYPVKNIWVLGSVTWQDNIHSCQQIFIEDVLDKKNKP